MIGRVTDAMVLDYIRLYIDRNGYPPTIREIARGLGFASSSAAWHHVESLERDGRITRGQGLSRTIRILAEAS